MLVFFSEQDLSFRIGDRAAREVLRKELEEALGRPCLVVDMWCCGAVAVGDDALEDITVLYSANTFGERNEKFDNFREVLHQKREPGADNGTKDRQSCLRFVIPLLLGFLAGAIISLLLQVL